MKTIIIDCSYIGHRSKYAMKELSYREKQTGVMFALLSKVYELATRFETNRFIFAWDSQASLRKEFYPPYKERKEEATVEEIKAIKMVKEQLMLARLEMLPKIGFKNSFIAKGYEADDVIARLVFKYGNSDDFIVISRDRDLYQLLDFCSMYNPDDKRIFTREDLMQEWECTTQQWKAMKGIAGCGGNGHGDNVEGVVGVKEKTAIKFLKDELKPTSKAYQAIINSSGIIARNQKLTWLPYENCPMFETQEEEFYLDDFMEVCQEYGFNSFIDKVKKFEKWKGIFEMKRRKN